MSAVVLNRQPLALSSGGVEALKWVALLAMVADHVNAVFYARELGTWATATGRVAMPLFAIVLGYNLARLGADRAACLRRLLLFGALALPAHAYLFAQAGGWWPLNIMATFAVAVGVLVLQERGQGMAALALFLLGGAFAEYWWPGVVLVLAVCVYARRPGTREAVAVVASLLALCAVNGNAWALLALPLVVAASAAELRVPRLRWVFWWFYPVHLATLAAVSVLLQ